MLTIFILFKRTFILFLVLTAAGCRGTGIETAVPSANVPTIPVNEIETAVPPTINPSPQPITLHNGNDIRLVWTQQTTIGAFLEEVGVMVEPTDQLFADDEFVPYDALTQWPLPETLEIGRYLTITIEDGEKQMLINTSAETVSEALQEAGVALFSADRVEPLPQSKLHANMVIRIQRSIPLTIQVDGRVIQTRSAHTNPHDVLAEAGITLVESDFSQPGPNAILHAEDVIQVIRVTESFLTEDEPIPYQTLWQASDELDLDTQAVISPGTPGILRRRIRVRYENGIELSQTYDGEWVEREPVNEVIGYGTRINIGTVQTEQGPREYWRIVRMRVTAYTAASSGKSPDHPRYGITASGLPAGKGVVAIDRNIVPWKSELFIPGYGVALAGDTGGGVRGRWIDLGYSEENFQSWSGYVDVYYLTPVPPPQDINYLLPSILP